ncbi:MAG: hypothetical protein KGZ71_10365 [Desulfobulbaceae bacterium]|nr:hypothetical protein [Candidatus Kapabacteria bacterium]MBS4000872.1 hypothetical protein [Desulfobulbaceae bacterium]
MSFAEILDAVDILPIEDRIELTRILQQRLIEDRREILVQEIVEANQELKSGKLKIQTIDQIMSDIENEL